MVGSNSAGNNVFFVRNDLLGKVPVLNPQDAWVESKFRESRSLSGQLTFLPVMERLKLLADMPLISLDDGQQYSVKQLYSVEKV